MRWDDAIHAQGSECWRVDDDITTKASCSTLSKGLASDRGVSAAGSGTYEGRRVVANWDAPDAAAVLSDARISGVSVPRVLLIGMMAAGKTTVGRELESLSGWPYLDNDELVLLATGRPTPEVLAMADEATLRRVESAALGAALAAEPPLIAGVAAGVIVEPEARRTMRAGGFVVYLRAPLGLLVERVEQGGGRPWIADDPAGELERLYEGREALYQETAHLILDVDGRAPKALADSIIEALESRVA